MTTVLAAQGLIKSFGDLIAVNGVSFEIVEGETFGLLGPNGAGKTTSISMIAGLLEPDNGTIHVAGTRSGPIRPMDGRTSAWCPRKSRSTPT